MTQNGTLKGARASAQRATGAPAILSLVFLMASLLLVSDAFAAPSTSTSNDVSLQLWAGTDNWTQAGASESFILVVTNANATLPIYEVHINLSRNSTGYAVFTVSGAQASDWVCNDLTTDGTSSATSVNCSTAASPIAASSLNITFSAQAMSFSTEDDYDWQVVAAANWTPGYSVTQNITSGIDGLAPRFSGYYDNVTVASGSGSVYLSANVTDLNLDPTTVTVQVVNVDSGEAMDTPAFGYEYYATASPVWKYYIANVPLLSFPDGNYTFNVTASDNVSNSNSSLAAPASWFFYDAMAPSVSLGSPGNNANVSSGPVAFSFTPYETSGVLANCSLWLTNPAGGGWHLNSTNSSSLTNGQQNAITVNLNDGTYTWNVMCFDGLANSSLAASNVTFNVANRSNIIVMDIAASMNQASPYPGQNILFNVTVKNNGSENVANMTWLELKLDYDDSACSSPLNTSYYNISESFLTVGGQKSIYYNVTLESTQGTYYVCAVADYNNTETDESDINDNAFTESFSTHLNVTVLSILNGTGSSSSAPGLNMTIIVNVTFQNGTYVTGLTRFNFSVYDDWLATSGNNYLNRTENQPLNYTRLSSSEGANYYTLTYTIPSIMVYASGEDDGVWYGARYAEYGIHGIEVNATKSIVLAGGSYTGTGLSTQPYTLRNYTITAPYLGVDLESYNSIDNMVVGDVEDDDITYSNSGNENITETLTAHMPDEDNGATDGDVDIENNLTSDRSISGLNAGAQYVVQNLQFNADAAGTVDFTFNLSVTHSGELYWHYKTYRIEVAAEEEEDAGAAATTSPTANYECTVNSSCDSDEYCKNLVCVALTCPDGYTATDHVCKFKNVYDVSILSYPKDVALLQGGNATSVVSVRNSGNTDLTVTVSAETGVGSVNSSSFPASQLIKSNETKNFTVSFSAGADAAIGKYTGSFKATTSFTAAKDSEGFTLTVNPLPEAIKELEKSYENCTTIYDQLVADFNAVKGQLSGDNLTMLETKVNETMTVFASLKQSMEDGDYAQAAVYISQLDALMDAARARMTELGIEEGVGSVWGAVAVWLIVAVVCIGAVGLLLYMLVPPQGYTHGKGYSPMGKGTVKDRFGGMMSSLRNALPKRGMGGGSPKVATASDIVRKYQLSYEGSYKKLQSSYSSQQPGMSNKMKSIFKKK